MGENEIASRRKSLDSMPPRHLLNVYCFLWFGLLVPLIGWGEQVPDPGEDPQFHSTVVKQNQQLPSSKNGTGDPAEEEVESGRASIELRDLKRHIETLASDTFEGREAGSRGGRAAGIYIGQEFQKLELAGAAEEGYYQDFGNDFRNVLAKIPGEDPQVGEQYLIISAHYDHVGYGTNQNSEGPIGYIHNGADDNASGTALVLEVAEAIKNRKQKLRRTVVFALWDAEEKGLLGSYHWTRQPTLPIESLRFLINTDMIGRIRDEKIELYGSRTAIGLRDLVSESNRRTQFVFDFTWEMPDNSDNYPFFQKRIPLVMPFSGYHEDYHRPSDDPPKINYDGTLKVTQWAYDFVCTLADMPEIPSFRERCLQEGVPQQRWVETPPPVPVSRLGATWVRAPESDGFILESVNRNSPAHTAGLQAGDRLIEFDSTKLDQSTDLAGLLLSANSEVEVVVIRPNQPEEIRKKLKLAGTRTRLGIYWREDETEKGRYIVSRVLAGSPAEFHRLKPGDRLRTIDGKSINSAEELRKVLSESKEIELEYERAGRIETIKVPLLGSPEVPQNQ